MSLYGGDWRCRVQVADYELSGVRGWRVLQEQRIPAAEHNSAGLEVVEVRGIYIQWI